MNPFRKVFRRPGMRRILLPFTLGLTFFAMTAFAVVGL